MNGVSAVAWCRREVRGDAIWQQLREHAVSHLNTAPTVVSSILNAPEAGPLTRPVLITTAGAPPSPTTIAHPRPQLRELPKCPAPPAPGAARKTGQVLHH
jgi:acyl-coenzyme A synthetase/AMP-(fatty) acid ligase